MIVSLGNVTGYWNWVPTTRPRPIVETTLCIMQVSESDPFHVKDNINRSSMAVILKKIALPPISSVWANSCGEAAN